MQEHRKQMLIPDVVEYFSYISCENMKPRDRSYVNWIGLMSISFIDTVLMSSTFYPTFILYR